VLLNPITYSTPIGNLTYHSNSMAEFFDIIADVGSDEEDFISTTHP
jgi:hypothetical protein